MELEKLAHEEQNMMHNTSNLSLPELIAHYEESVAEHMDNLALIINLLVIYFDAWDPGTIHQHNLQPEFINRCCQNYETLLNSAKEKHPNSIELEFWENYIAFITTGTVEFDELYQKFAFQDKSQVPFFCFKDTHPEKARHIKDQITPPKTFKEAYMHSILSSNCTD